MDFFTGLHQPSDVHHFERCFVSVNRLRNRRGPFECDGVLIIIDSGAFTELSRDQDVDEAGNLIPNDYREPVESYAREVVRWNAMIAAKGGKLLAAVSQDYMCEKFILDKTGRTIQDHQRLTIDRYDGLLRCETGVYILPVLQGFAPQDYVRHIRMYGAKLPQGAWVGVGSICKRNGDPRAIESVLLAIHDERPDLRLHGFGLKTTALASGIVDELLETADSMGWSYQGRMAGGSGNDWRYAMKWKTRIETRHIQKPLFL